MTILLYANEYLKNCNGYIEDSEDVAIKFINDENVLGDIQEKYVNVLNSWKRLFEFSY